MPGVVLARAARNRKDSVGARQAMVTAPSVKHNAVMDPEDADAGNAVDGRPPPADELDELDDIAAARVGDVVALGRMYDRHAAVVLALCRRFGREVGETGAEDAMQETFVRACRMLDTLDDPRHVRSWLIGIARRVCAERRRGDERRGRRERAVGEIGAARGAGHPGEAAAQQEDLEKLDAALDALPEDERLAIHLHYLEPDAPRATQARLGVSRSGFYKLLGRARERLAGLMQDMKGPQRR